MTGISRRMRVAAWVGAGVLGGGVITGIAVAQLGVASAASPSPGPAATPGPWRQLHRLGGGPLAHLGGRILHGEATVLTPQGKTQVVDFQHGKITAVTASTVTVRSTDGFTATYTVDKTTRIVLNGTAGTLSRLKTGDEVRVFATKSGATATAKAVIDGMPARAFGFGHGWRQALPMAPPA